MDNVGQKVEPQAKEGAMGAWKAELVVLDFDGTLADTRPIIVQSMQLTLAEMGLPQRTEAECATVIGLPLRACFTTLMGIDDELGERCAEVYRRVFDTLDSDGAVVLYPEVADTMRRMHEGGVRMAICSSRGRATLHRYAERLGLRPYVEMIVSSDDVAHAKPHPEPTQRILEAMGVEAGRCLVVGDAAFDIAMGRAAGCATCGVTYGNQSAVDLREAGADWLVDNFADVAAVAAGRQQAGREKHAANAVGE